MEQKWTVLKKYKNEDDFLDYLVDGLKLPNADAIYNKLATVPGGIIPYAHGTRRLRYAAGAFYVEQAEGPPPLTDVGVGKHIAVKALQERWQGMAGRAIVTVKLDKTMQSAVSFGEYDKGGKEEVHVKLNPLKLKGPKQVEERILWVDKCLKE
jgi:hypothetical protein